MNSKWLRVGRSEPCQICGKPDWCTYTDDGQVACCMRVDSPKIARNGGFIHRLTAPRMREYTATPRNTTPDIDCAYMISNWMRQTPGEHIKRFAKSLGVNQESLIALGACWGINYSAWAFPMWAGNGGIIGIRLRGVDGRKWAVKGSRSGVFMPDNRVFPQDMVLVCEGPTDTAAALSMGFYAIGRPSCNAGMRDVITACVRLGVRDLVIVADNDGPGLSWAKRSRDEAVASKLRSKIFVPPCKDIRSMLVDGATRADVENDLMETSWKR